MQFTYARKWLVFHTFIAVSFASNKGALYEETTNVMVQSLTQTPEEIYLEEHDLGNLSHFFRTITEFKIDTSQIKTLSLPKSQITSLEPLLSLNWALLTSLTLSANPLGDEQASYIPKMGAPHLKMLALNSVDITHVKWIKGMDWPALEILLLGGNSIISLEGIQNATMPNLKVLEFSETKGTDLNPFQEVKWPNLTMMLLENVPITEESLSVLKNFPKLETVFLNEELLNAIQQILPNLKIKKQTQLPTN